MNYAEMVREFHEKFGHPINEELTLAQRAFRCRLIVEEWAEYEAAVEANDRVEIADALGDLLYVLVGTGVSMGVEPDIDWIGRGPVFDYIGESVTTLSADGRFGECSNVMADVKGAASKHAIPLDAVFAEIHRSNMTKTPNGTEKPGKGDGYSPPDIAGILARHDAAVAVPDEEC